MTTGMKRRGTMNVASCGLGVNSIAGIMEAVDQGIVFDEILFANTGRGKKYGERAATYDFLHMYLNPWLVKHGQPKAKMLHSRNAEGEIITLYEESFKLKTLPSIVFGFKTCSQRFKAQPQEKFLNNNGKAMMTWAIGERVVKWIFYDADEPGRAKDYSDKKYEVRYFLIEENWGRYECEEKIQSAGLPLPPKSSCFFCPSMKPYQIIDLYEKERDKFYEAIALERNALTGGRMTNVKGLGRDFSWWDLIVAYRYIKLFKRNMVKKPGITIHPSLVKMIKKINLSKAEKLYPRIKNSEKTCDVLNDLFTQRQDMPCGCYDGH